MEEEIKTLKSTKTEYENNWKEKSLENLEKEYWGEPTYDSHLVKTCHLLRKKPIKDFETEDLRIMIGQNIGLKYLIPIALQTLKDNVLAEGDFYKGDLLSSVLVSDKEFWSEEKGLSQQLEEIVLNNEQLLKEQEPKLLKAFSEWKKKS